MERHHSIAAGVIILILLSVSIVFLWHTSPPSLGALLATTTSIDEQGRYRPDAPEPRSRCATINGLPDHACTPGGVATAVTSANIKTTICQRGYTKKIRPPYSYTRALKQRQLILYGLSGSLGDFEEDHLIPLELGGDPAAAENLWPEAYAPRPGARDKDHVENYLRAMVCNSTIPLADAQRLIATDWVSVYNAVGPTIVNY